MKSSSVELPLVCFCVSALSTEPGTRSTLMLLALQKGTANLIWKKVEIMWTQGPDVSRLRKAKWLPWARLLVSEGQRLPSPCLCFFLFPGLLLVNLLCLDFPIWKAGTRIYDLCLFRYLNFSWDPPWAGTIASGLRTWPLGPDFWVLTSVSSVSNYVTCHTSNLSNLSVLLFPHVGETSPSHLLRFLCGLNESVYEKVLEASFHKYC